MVRTTLAFILVSLILTVAGGVRAAAPDVTVADLDVLFISRTPRYPGYRPNYGLPGRQDQPTLFKDTPDGPRPLTEEEIASTKHWPDEGETVTYTAVIENKGSVASPPFEYAWYLDDERVAEGKTDKGLAPGERMDFKHEWPWAFERHRVAFWADPMRRTRQLSYANDKRTVWTHAKLLRCVVDRVTYDSFAENRNVVGTYSFEDWCQEHADWMNHLWEESVYPTAPDGVLERVSVDTILLVEDQNAMNRLGVPLEQGYDGGWWFGRNEDCSRWAAGMDWGLIHEWGHQFGLTDLYALDVGGSHNLVEDTTGTPLLIGRLSVFAGTMMHGHGPVVFSEDQAIALNHQLWRRRGYYGDYYYNLAPRNYVRILDRAGEPVAGARLRFWQRDMRTGTLEGEPTFAGETGKDGRFLLPNRAAPHVVTYGRGGSGYELRDNPFGHIHVVGPNGVMLIEIAARGQTDYTWLEIPQLNVAKERGDGTEAVVTYETDLPVEGAARAPDAVTVVLDGTEAHVTLPGARRWVVMRTTPGTWEWAQVGVADGETYVDTLPRGGLFRYAACVETGGKLSARSTPYGVASLRDPWGIALAPDGMVFVRDRSAGQTLLMRPDGSAVGYIGSVHWHLEGSYDHATTATGELIIAKWPDGYDAKRGWVRRINPRVKIGEWDRKDLAGGEFDSDEPGRFLKPMGVWVDAQDGRIVVADTGNDRVQILDKNGQVVDGGVVTGFKQPHKALLMNGKLVVCDTGAKQIVVLERADEGGGWKALTVIPGFSEPVSCCLGPSESVLIADRGYGRIFAISAQRWQMLEWFFPSRRQAKVGDLRGIAYDAARGDLLYVDGEAKRVVRTHIED